MNWKEVWQNKEPKMLDDLETLLENDGFDSCGGDINAEAWLNYNKEITRIAGIKPKESIYEVGCGSGAFLYPFYKRGHNVGGIDYANKQISMCKILFNGDFETGEAKQLDYMTSYDNVLSFSVFQYFPDLDYASEVLNRMMTKAKERVLILDIPDIELKERAEAERRALDPDYDIRYKDLKHLYYDKEWFYDMCLDYDNNQSFEIFYHTLPGYPNSQYRYSVVIGKP